MFSCYNSNQALTSALTGKDYTTNPLFSIFNLFNYTKADIRKIHYYLQWLLFLEEEKKEWREEGRKTATEEQDLSFLYSVLCSWELIENKLWKGCQVLPCHSGWHSLKGNKTCWTFSTSFLTSLLSVIVRNVSRKKIPINYG